MSRLPRFLLLAVLAAHRSSLGTVADRGQADDQPTANGRITPAICAAGEYSPLDQINASNFNQLQVAWRFKTDNLGPRPEYKLEGTPVMVKGMLYTTGGTRRSVVSLDGRTGEVNWVHSIREGQARGGVAAPAVGSRRVVLDRRQRRRAGDLRDDRLSARRARRQNRLADSVLRQRRRRRSESRRRQGGRTSRSISRPARSACTRRRPSPVTS